MMFVRSTGGSHNPAEHADLGDAALGAAVVAIAAYVLSSSSRQQ
jgi:acetylornithine deacetylase/succinyl-diaminopimelate desuccinylase-like protein